MRFVTGSVQLLRRPVQPSGRVRDVVGPEPAGVLFGVEPAAELAEQLRQSAGHDCEFSCELVECGWFAGQVPQS